MELDKNSTKLFKKVVDLGRMFTGSAWISNLRGKEKVANNVLKAILVAKDKCRQVQREDMLDLYTSWASMVEACKCIIAEGKAKQVSEFEPLVFADKLSVVAGFFANTAPLDTEGEPMELELASKKLWVPRR